MGVILNEIYTSLLLLLFLLLLLLVVFNKLLAAAIKIFDLFVCSQVSLEYHEICESLFVCCLNHLYLYITYIWGSQLPFSLY